MNWAQIIDTILQLSKGQGFYGRLYRDICRLEKEAPEEFENFKNKLEAKNFKEAVDLVLYLENGDEDDDTDVEITIVQPIREMDETRLQKQYEKKRKS